MSLSLVALTNPLVWALPGNVARKLRGFAAVEAESVLEMRAAAALTEDPERRALYLQHALDEERHARVFSRAATDVDGVTTFPHVSSDHLFERLGESRFLAFVHRGERRGRQQFESYGEHWRERDPRLAKVFLALIEDERRHEAYTGRLLTVVAGGDAQARAAVRWATAWEAWRAWLRVGRVAAGALFVTLMCLLYFALAPLAFLVQLALPARGGWRAAASAVKPK